MTEFTFKVRKDVITIKQYLTNIEKFVNVHPLIYKMTALGENKHKVFEKVMIGVMLYNFTYKAFITHDKDSVKIVATIMGITTISMLFTFKEEDNITTTNERLTVNSPLPIKNYMYKLIEKQHRIMLLLRV